MSEHEQLHTFIRTDRQTDRLTQYEGTCRGRASRSVYVYQDRQTDRLIVSQTDRETDTQTDSQTDRHIDVPSMEEQELEEPPDLYTFIGTDRQTNRHTDRQKDRQTDTHILTLLGM